MLKADHARTGLLKIGPCLACKGQNNVSQFDVRSVSFKAAQTWDMVGGKRVGRPRTAWERALWEVS